MYFSLIPLVPERLGIKGNIAYRQLDSFFSRRKVILHLGGILDTTGG
jgi:hypothetical protein